MKTPKDTTNGDKSPANESTTGPEIRKIPAHVGVIDHAPVGAGTPAQAGQPGEVRPASSALVGDGTDTMPAAEKKPAPGTRAKAAPKDTPFAPKSDQPKSDQPKTDSVPPHTTPAKAATPVRKTGFWPVVLGGVVAAGLGSAATIYALPHLPAGWVPAAPMAQQGDDQAMIDAASQAGREAAEQAIAAAPAAGGVPDDLMPRIEALEEQVAALGQPAPEADAPQADGDATPAAGTEELAALRDRLDEQQARLDELAARPAFDPEAAAELQQQIETAAAEAQSSLDQTRAQAEELQSAATESTRRAEAVAAIAALQTALDAGVTPDQAREALEGAGLDTPEALQAQVPSLTELQADFPEAARAALRASLRDTSASGEGNLLTNFLRAQTGARSVEPREGDDADAILSRADADVQAGRIDAALTQMQALPEPATAAPAMADWLSRATAYSQARAALSDLSSGTN